MLYVDNNGYGGKKNKIKKYTNFKSQISKFCNHG